MKMRSRYPSSGSIMIATSNSKRTAGARLSPNLKRHAATNPDRSETQPQVRANIQGREGVFAGPPEIHSFVAECREGGKPAQDPNENQRACFHRKISARLSQLREEPDGQAADKIHRQRSTRKGGAAAQILNESAYGITQDGTDGPANACQN